MTDETIVAVFDTAAHAEAAVASLKAASVPADAIDVHSSAASTSGTTSSAAAPREEGFWASLFGGSPDHDTAVYDRSLEGGSTVVAVRTPESHIARVLEILETHHPIDIDERAASYGLTGTTGMATQPAATAMPAATMPVATTQAAAPMARSTDEPGMIQLSEESLAVGKRVVNNGGTRIRRFVVETPVQEDITLHSERVVLERRPVTDGRAVRDSFSDKTIEMTETAEEAVVSKTARVVEEIGLRKEASDRVETIHDTVRKDEVEVVQVPGTTTTTTTVEPKLPPKV